MTLLSQLIQLLLVVRTAQAALNFAPVISCHHCYHHGHDCHYLEYKFQHCSVIQPHLSRLQRHDQQPQRKRAKQKQTSLRLKSGADDNLSDDALFVYTGSDYDDSDDDDMDMRGNCHGAFQSSSCCLENDGSNSNKVKARVQSSPLTSLQSRRGTFSHPLSRRLLATTIVTNCVLPLLAAQPSMAIAANNNRRQLEVCIVALLRVLYWAIGLVQEMEEATATTTIRKQVYLQARLGAKAILTGKMGDGGTGRVYVLATLQIPGCLKDMEAYTKELRSSSSSSFLVSRFADLEQDFRESLAALVEFDGLDTLTDPSPRSALTMGQYTDQKFVFVQRSLNEKVIPTGFKMIATLETLNPQAVQRSKQYIQSYYSSEIVVMAPLPSTSTTVINN